MYSFEELDNDFEKAKDVVLKCKTKIQLDVARQWVFLWDNKCCKDYDTYCYTAPYFKKLVDMLMDMENKLKVDNHV